MTILLILRWLLLGGKLGATLVEEAVPNIPVWPTILVTTVLTLYGYGHHNGELACQAVHAKTEAKTEAKNAKITKNIDNLNNVNLNKRLRKFQRD